MPNELTQDIYMTRQNDELPFRYETKKAVDDAIKMRADQLHPFGEMEGLPYFAIKGMMSSTFKGGMPQPLYSANTADVMTAAFSCNVKRLSKAEVILLNTSRFMVNPEHSLLEADRMMNPEL